jgi:hypothetical protein
MTVIGDSGVFFIPLSIFLENPSDVWAPVLIPGNFATSEVGAFLQRESCFLVYDERIAYPPPLCRQSVKSNRSRLASKRPR